MTTEAILLPTVTEEEVLGDEDVDVSSLPGPSSKDRLLGTPSESQMEAPSSIHRAIHSGPSLRNGAVSPRHITAEVDQELAADGTSDEEDIQMLSFRKRVSRSRGDMDDLSNSVKREATRSGSRGDSMTRKAWNTGWRVVHHTRLPDWLKDNDFLVKGHRPELRSFKQCFKSVFRIHTETGNIWTHLLGMVMFVGIFLFFISRPSFEVQWQDKLVFGCFFLGAIMCLGCSWVFHTVYCHSRRVGKLFNKFDYCGITFLTVGSFIPWLYYAFYCRLFAKIVYLCLIALLGSGCLVVSLWDKFSDRRFRAIRAGMFVALGLSGVIPALHVVIVEGFWKGVTDVCIGWLVLMAFLYILGAVIYSARIPEKFIPGKCDIWFQSHQIFHILVVTAALVHYHGVTTLATYRLTVGDCMEVVREL